MSASRPEPTPLPAPAPLPDGAERPEPPEGGPLRGLARRGLALPTPRGTLLASGLAVPSLAFVLALLLRLIRLGDANLWWDEALAVWAVRKGLVGATLWTASDVHPPLYFWSLWGWVQLFGEGEFAMRLLSALLGALTAVAAYALGRLVGGRVSGALAALLVAISRFHVWWSQEMRMYVLAGLLCTLAIHYLLRWLRAEQEDDRRAWRPLLGYALCALGALYTIFLSGATVLAANLTALLALATAGSRRGRMLRRWALAQAAVALPVAGWLTLSWGRMRSWSVAEPMSPGTYARLVASLLTTGVSTDVDRMLPYAAVPLGVLLVGGLVAAWGRLRERPQSMRPTRATLDVAALLLAVAVPVAAVYLATMPRSLFYTPRVEARYLVPFAPAFCVLLAWAIVTLGRRLRPAGLVAGALTLAVFAGFLPGYYGGRVLRDELQTMTRAILSQAAPGDVVLLDSGSRYPIFDYYYGRVRAAERPPVLLLPPDDREITAASVDALLAASLPAGGRVWLAEVDVNLTDPERLARGWLEARYPLAASWAYDHNALLLYDPEGRPPAVAAGYAPQHPGPSGSLDLGGGRLAGWDLPVTRYGPGDQLHLALYWGASPEASVTLALQDAAGRVVLATEAPPPAPAALDCPAGDACRRQQLDLSVTPATPAGAYDLVLRAGEDAVTLARVHVVGAEGPAPANAPVALAATFDGGLSLVGARVSAERVAPGKTLLLDLYWRADAPDARDLVVFSHLLGEAFNPATQGPVWAGHDARPNDGSLPVSLWPVGEVVVDRHLLAVDPAAPEGVYRLEVGLYTAADGARLGADGGDHVLLPLEIRVVP